MIPLASYLFHNIKNIRFRSGFYLYIEKTKAPARNVRGLRCNRQQSILPGRFQPSTFDA